MADPLGILAQLAAREVERARDALRQIAADIAPVEQRTEALRAQIAGEIARGALEPALALVVASWLWASRAQERGLQAELDRLERMRASGLALLQERRTELRRLELLLQRRRRRAEEAAARQEQRALDDLAAARYGSRRAPAP